MHFRNLIFPVLILLTLVACGKEADKATALYYAEQEPGGEPYRTRMIVTARYLRMDDGGETKDFLLFDRREKTLYSVSAADARILVIAPKPISIASPVALAHTLEQDAAAYPAVGGKKVTHYRLLTNQKPCYDLFVAEGMLPEAVQALREYRQILAGQQAATLAGMPEELQTPCDLANNIFAPVRYLDYGLPIRLDETGVRTSELVDYKTDFEAGPALFELPASYRRITIEAMRGG